MSEKDAAVACTNSQLQEQQERNIAMQHKAKAESSKAAAAAAAQTKQSEKLAQQLQAQLEAADSRGDGLQSAFDVQGKKIKDLTAELSASKTAAGELQVCVVSRLCKCCNFACKQISGLQFGSCNWCVMSPVLLAHKCQHV